MVLLDFVKASLMVLHSKD